MFKKRYALLIAAAFIACVIFIPPVQAAAESVLSVFRVADTKLITISVNDVQEILTLLKDAEAKQAEHPQETVPQSEIGSIIQQILGKAESDIKPIGSVGDFTAFPFSLPEAMDGELPQLYAADSQTQSVTLDTTKISAELKELGAAVTLDQSLNGTTVIVNTPPAIVAEYADVLFAATQNVYVDAPDAVVNQLWSALISIPAIPENVRAQLQAIDPKTGDVYLPVIEGLGREADLGGTTGYVYSSGDLAQVLGMLPDFADDTHRAELQDLNASVLIWTKNGVLYYLAGEKSDSELIQIARSLR
jgi:hypothetical protein